MRAALLALVIGLSASAVAPAHATILNWTFGSDGSGQLTTIDTANSAGGYLVTAFTGTTYLGNVTALLPPGSLGNDNLLYFNRPASSSVLGSGIGLNIGGTKYELVTSPITFRGNATYMFLDGNRLFGFDFTPVVPVGVHEPATWATFMSAFGIAGLVGFATRRFGRTTAQLA